MTRIKKIKKRICLQVRSCSDEFEINRKDPKYEHHIDYFMLKLPKDQSHLIHLIDVLLAGQSKIRYVSVKFFYQKKSKLSDRMSSDKVGNINKFK